MSLPKKGSRKIVVDSMAYRWYIRRPDMLQEELTLAIQQLESNGAILHIELPRGQIIGWLWAIHVKREAITPKKVEQYIRAALEKG